jgi:hypothetical protein
MEGRNWTETQILKEEGNHKNGPGINKWKEIKTRKQTGGKTDRWTDKRYDIRLTKSRRPAGKGPDAENKDFRGFH